ncbi:FecR family protein [Halalkalibaculum sp. DA3122]|uniref:FecR family protein n=1 Tax=Halalkalibaculum sp. DA3122 TaxID=3373607 RepID=UPI0037550227
MGNNSLSIDELTQDISFIRWVKGTARPEEIKKWDAWLGEVPENRCRARKAQQKVLGINFVTRSVFDLELEWSELDQRITGSILSSKSAPVAPKKYNRILKTTASASVVILAADVGPFPLFTGSENLPAVQAETEWTTVETPYRQLKTVAFSDGSTIILNANSSVTFPSCWMRTRSAELFLEGEAYFSIPDRNSADTIPFKVTTTDGTIYVTGTRFVVKTDENNTAVALEEGAITVTRNLDGEPPAVAYEVKPNELAVLHKQDAHVSISAISNIEVFTSWTDHKLVLDSSPFSYLVQRIKETYGTNVTVTDDRLYHRKLTGSIQLKDLSHVVQSVSDVMDIHVTQKDGTVYFGNKNR